MTMLKYSSFILAAGLSSVTTAGGMGVSSGPSWVAEISGAAVWEKAGRTQTIEMAPDIQKTYVAHKDTDVLAEGEVFLGLQKRFNSQILLQLGLAGALTGNARLQGIIWDDADPAFDNYTYQYKVRHGRVAVKTKILASNQGFGFMPWISGSVGIGFNQAHNFTNTPTIFEAIETSNFTSHTKTSLSYTVACGIQKAIRPHIQLGIGYEFADWGKSQLGRAEGQTLNQGLALNHLTTNGVIVNLAYVS